MICLTIVAGCDMPVTSMTNLEMDGYGDGGGGYEDEMGNDGD